MENVEILRRMDALAPKWQAASEVLDEIERYIMPIACTNPYVSDAASKKWTTREIWDSTAPIGADRLASVFYSNLISTAFEWFEIEFGIPKLNVSDPKAKGWIQDTSSRMFNALNSSNFPTEMAVAFREYVGPASFCLTQQLANETEWDGFEFSVKSIRTVRYEEDHLGRVFRYYEEFAWTPSQIISKFGKGDPKKNVPKTVLDRDEAGDQKEMKVIFGVYPRFNKKPWSMEEKARAAEERPIGFKFFLRETKETLGEEGGFYEMPIYIGKYARAANTPLGYGPSHMALPTVKLLNGLQESVVLSGEKVLDPATIVTERGLLSDLDLGRGGLTTVRSLDDIKPYESVARFDVSDNLIARHQMMVRKLYREDDVQLKESPAMTASEATLRVEQMNRLFGPQMAGLHIGTFNPLLQTTFNTMWREGQIEKPPDSVLELAPKLKVQYRGPMMRSLRSDDVVAIERLASGVAALTKMNLPEAGDVFKADEAVRAMADRLGTPGALLRSPEEVKKLREERQQLQQAAAQAEIQKTAAEGARAAAGADEMMAGMKGGGR